MKKLLSVMICLVLIGSIATISVCADNDYSTQTEISESETEDGSVAGSPAQLIDASTLKATFDTNTLTYNGKVRTPKITIKTSSNKVVPASYYAITYPKGRKNVGKYTYRIDFLQTYKGTIKKTFTIIPKGTSIKSLSAKVNSLTVKWTRQKTQTSGYEIRYSTNSKMKNAKICRVKSTKSYKKTLSKLKNNTKYYLQIRTYKVVNYKDNKIKIYSKWSKKKSIRTLKPQAWKTFTATAYCGCAKCCGRSGARTASGRYPQANRTISVDTSIIPLGTKVEIEGYGVYVAEDTGSAIKNNIIDMYFSSHSEALAFGRRTVRIRVLK